MFCVAFLFSLVHLQSKYFHFLLLPSGLEQRAANEGLPSCLLLCGLGHSLAGWRWEPWRAG